MHRERRRFALLIFGGGLDLIAGKIKRDFGVSLAWRRKVQGVPFDRNFPAANPEKAAEIDDRSPHPSASIDNYIDDAAHIFVGGAQDLPAENALDFVIIEHRHRWRFYGGCCGPIGWFAGADAGAVSELADPTAVTTTKKAAVNAVFVSLLARIMVPLELSPLSRMDQLGSRLMPKPLRRSVPQGSAVPVRDPLMCAQLVKITTKTRRKRGYRR